MKQFLKSCFIVAVISSMIMVLSVMASHAQTGVRIKFAGTLAKDTAYLERTFLADSPVVFRYYASSDSSISFFNAGGRICKSSTVYAKGQRLIDSMAAIEARRIDGLSSFTGSTNIVTLGTITTGVWSGTIVTSQKGGTGIDNGGRTLTISTNSGTLAFAGSGTTMTMPSTSSTLARSSGTNTFTGVQTFSSQITMNGGFVNATNVACSLAGGKLYTSTDYNMWIRGESASGNMQFAGEGGIQFYPNYSLTTNAYVNVDMVPDGAGSYRGFLSTGSFRADGNIQAGYSTHAGATGGGGFKSANPIGGSTSADYFRMGNSVSGTFTLKVDRYVELEIGGVIHKLAEVN